MVLVAGQKHFGPKWRSLSSLPWNNPRQGVRPHARGHHRLSWIFQRWKGMWWNFRRQVEVGLFGGDSLWRMIWWCRAQEERCETICEVFQEGLCSLKKKTQQCFGCRANDVALNAPWQVAQGLNAWIEKETEKLRKLQEHGQEASGTRDNGSSGWRVTEICKA